VSEASLPGIKDLSTAEMLLVERQCNCFEDTWDAWHEGAPPVLEEYLTGIMGPAAEVLFCELLHLELAYRRQHGERPTLDEYLPRFPNRERLVRGVFAREELEATGPEPAPEPSGTLPHIPGYDLEGVLGKGGMGIVYRARQLRANRVVALKMIRPGFEASPQHLELFWAEAKAVACFQHPNIVPLYEVGEHWRSDCKAPLSRLPGRPSSSRRWRGPCTTPTRRVSSTAT
jgi:serine/threonine-protein kinase